MTRMEEYAFTKADKALPETPVKTIRGTFDSTWKDQLLTWNGVSMTYDAIGNMVKKGNTTYTWTQGRKLSTVNNGKKIQYFYDHTGRRARKTVDGVITDFRMAGELLMSQKAGDVTTYFSYDSAGNLIGMSAGSNRYFYTRNAQNDITGLIDEKGVSVVQYQYDSWGKLLGITGSLASTIGKRNPFRYRGYYYDDETGFYYVSSRYYDPEIGRWINADDAIAGVGGDIRGYNLFAYCMNDPVNMSDHTGHWPQWIKNAASAVVNAVKKAVTVVANTVKSAVSSASNILKASSNSLPKKGEPRSSQTLPNPDGTPKQKRWYGPDGNPERDRDYNHPGNMPFPHDHEWKNGERGKEHLPPDPSYKMSWKPVIGAGLVVICTVGIIAVAADDLTGVGVADDFLFGPLGAGVGEGLIMIFG